MTYPRCLQQGMLTGVAGGGPHSRGGVSASQARRWMCLLLALAGAACASSEDGHETSLQERASAIVGGELDTGHPAVVALDGPERDCSATIIDVRVGHGYALTAAHCAYQDDMVLLEGTEQADPLARYPVVGVRRHPAYAGDEHDVALVHFLGAGQETPHLPVMTPAQDELQVGDRGLLIGFGATGAEGADAGAGGAAGGGAQRSKQRRQIAVTISELNETTIRNEQLLGGACQGDSGGPLLVDADGAERIAGIIWRGDLECVEYGESIRVSHYFSEFIEATLAASEPLSCDQCLSAMVAGRARCRNAFEACTDLGCTEAQACFAGCRTNLCTEACLKEPGAEAYRPVAQCACAACVDACRSETICHPLMESESETDADGADAGGADAGSVGSSSDGYGGTAAMDGGPGGIGGGAGKLSVADSDAREGELSGGCRTVQQVPGPTSPWFWAVAALLSAAKLRRARALGLRADKWGRRNLS